MGTWQVLGQQHILKALEKGLGRGQLAHAFLIVGPPQSGKSTLAFQIAQALNCLETDPPCGRCAQCWRIQRGLHADVQVVARAVNERTGRMRSEISIDQIREVEQAASLGPYEGRTRVFIFDGAERFSPEAANALLKTLEEPPPNVSLLLLTTEEEGLLPTIRSRCQRLEIHLLDVETVAHTLTQRHSVPEDDAMLLAKLSGGRLGWAIAAAKDPKVLEARHQQLQELFDILEGGLERRFAVAQDLASRFARDRSGTEENLSLWLSWWRDLLVLKQGAPTLIANDDWKDGLEQWSRRFTSEEVKDAVRDTLATLERLEQNANARIALDVLMLALPASAAGGGGSRRAPAPAQQRHAAPEGHPRSPGR